MTILDRIVATKHGEIAAAQARLPVAELERQLRNAPPPRDFLAALRDPPGVQVIAEIKRSSPSAGTIRPGTDPIAIAQSYERHGAACLSVLTDGPYFGGCLGDMQHVRHAVSIPVLRKDFVLAPYQVIEARVAGADAVLLIAEILDDAALAALSRCIVDLGMTPLVECYEPANVARVVASGARLIGINNRDLRSFEVSLDHVRNLASQIPPDRTLVSESGIRTRADVDYVASAGVKAVLVGESLMRAEEPGLALGQLLGQCSPPPS